MIRKFLSNLLVVSFVAFAVISCEKEQTPTEEQGGENATTEDTSCNANAAGNESFRENPLADNSATALWVTPEMPNADAEAVISFRAGKKSPLYGYTGDVYAHIGILEYGVWKFVMAEWEENIDKCRMVKDETLANTWHLHLTPTIREYFGSGQTAITQIGIVIRCQDSKLKGIAEDSFIAVQDDLYEPFVPGEVVSQSMPSGCQYGINADGNQITFVLHDKDTRGEHRDYAYIMGDFNDWTLTNDDKSRMYRDDANGCWWITMTGLDPDTEYRFQYYLGDRAVKEGDPDTVIRLSDPFSEKILDPNNDRWINHKNIIYPEDQMVYPGDKGAAGTVSCVKINRDNFAWEPFEFVNRECPVIYEMLLGDFTETHDLAGALKKLDYLETLGINAVELMPIQEFDGNESWGYNPTHYFAVDKAYGTREQYKTFINECHKRGIAVIIDVVYNHSTGASPLAQLYWNSSQNKTASNNPYFNVDAPHGWSVFHDYNHTNKFVQDLVKRSLIYMIEEYNVDGFRFDLSKGFTQSSSGWDGVDQTRIALIKDYANAIKSADSDSYIILEHWGQYSEEAEYIRNDMHPWRKLNEAFCETAMGWSGSKGNLSGNHAWLDDTWGASGWVTFMESHDEERVAYKQAKYGHSSVKNNLKNSMENLALNAVCFLGTPGPKMIWQMGELGYDYNKWCSSDGTDYTGTGEHETDRKPVKWDYLDVPERKAVYDVYSAMNNLRIDNPELFGKGAYYSGAGSYSMSTWPVKGFYLEKNGKKVYGYANYHGDNGGSKSISIPSGTWTDILSGKTVQGGNYTLGSGDALVLVNSSVER